MEALAYYANQSPITDPGEMARHLGDLPHDLAGLQRIARGLVLHYRADNPSAHGIPENRLTEVDSRDAETMLQRLLELDSRPLTQPRPPQTRLLGCCRDCTVLYLTMARQLRIPARARVGFATYFVPGLNLDHEVAEVWDADQARWRLVDPELGDDHADPSDGFQVDPQDVPRDRFLVAGSAWQACRAGQADPETFLVDPGHDVEDTRGWPYLRHNLVHDLAALNKAEMLLWDSWGLIQREQLPERDLELLDHLARITRSGGAVFDELRRLYQAEAGCGCRTW
jgi:Transglutaminase-like superfamily